MLGIHTSNRTNYKCLDWFYTESPTNLHHISVGGTEPKGHPWPFFFVFQLFLGNIYLLRYPNYSRTNKQHVHHCIKRHHRHFTNILN